MTTTPLEVIEQLEALSPAALEHEISEQRDRLALMERLYAILTGDEIKTRKKRQPRQPRTPSATASQAAPSEAKSPGDSDDGERLRDDVFNRDLRRRLVDLLRSLGPLSWTQLISNAKASPTMLGPALKDAQSAGQIEKVDGLYRAVGK